MVVGSRKRLIGAHVHFVGRGDIKDRQLLHTLRMIEGHAMCHAATSIVAGHEELLIAQFVHYFGQVLSHRSFRIIVVFRITRWLRAITITA